MPVGAGRRCSRLDGWWRARRGVGDSVGPSDVDADAALRRLEEDIDHDVAHDDGSIGKTFLSQGGWRRPVGARSRSAAWSVRSCAPRAFAD